MKRTILTGLIALIASCLTSEVFAQEKRAQTTMKFLSTSLDARAAGMADAQTALQLGATAMLYNPSSMAQMQDKFSISASHLEWIADIKYNSAGVAYRPSDGRFGVFGLNLSAVDYGEFQETILARDEDSFVDLGTFSPTSVSAGLSYAVPLSSEFMIGGTVKYVSLDFGSAVVDINTGSDNELVRRDFDANTVAYDFGLLYKIGFKSLKFAMSVRNFSTEVTFDSEKTEIPLAFRIGLSMDLVDITELDPEMHSFIFAVDANRPRDYYEQILLGGEYTFMDRFSFRGGYVFPADESNLSFGAGIRQPVGDRYVKVDYSYTAFGIFDNVQRLSIQLGL